MQRLTLYSLYIAIAWYHILVIIKAFKPVKAISTIDTHQNTIEHTQYLTAYHIIHPHAVLKVTCAWPESMYTITFHSHSNT